MPSSPDPAFYQAFLLVVAIALALAIVCWIVGYLFCWRSPRWQNFYYRMGMISFLGATAISVMLAAYEITGALL